jgi:hypothetical protein
MVRYERSLEEHEGGYTAGRPFAVIASGLEKNTERTKTAPTLHGVAKNMTEARTVDNPDSVSAFWRVDYSEVGSWLERIIVDRFCRGKSRLRGQKKIRAEDGEL